MIVAGHLRFTLSGRVRVTTSDPTTFSNLTPTYGGLLCYNETLPPVAWNDEIGYAESSAVCVLVDPHSREAEEGFPGLRISTAEPITHWWCGLPFTDEGRLAVFSARTFQEHADDEERERAEQESRTSAFNESSGTRVEEARRRRAFERSRARIRNR